ncbi:MAG: lytic transglycosylase domain-containing protein [Silicimonas sp.]|nr:lytic transglycosylase domain-containing protein [Silicimonas sp.]
MVRIAIVLALCTGIYTPALYAQSSENVGGDFTFRRVAPPSTNSAQRITVQIDPNAAIYRITPGEAPRLPGDPRPKEAFDLPEGVVPATPSDFDWYWEVVSPSLGVDIASRFRAALALVEKEASKIGAPRLQTLQRIVNAHGVDILTSTIGTDVSPAFVLAVIAVESAGQTEAVSHAGATGLMQLMPATAARFGVSNSKLAKENIRGGVAYLDWLLKEFNRDPVMALAGYNAGEGAVAKHAGVPPFNETRGYVPKVLAAWTVARRLCVTPPELISDGCVFVGSALQTASDG